MTRRADPLPTPSVLEDEPEKGTVLAATGDLFKPGIDKHRGDTHPRKYLGHRVLARFNGVALHGDRTIRPGVVHCRRQQFRCDTLPPVMPVDHKTGDRPHGEVVNGLGDAGALQPSKVRPGSDRYPADRCLIRVSKQPRHTTGENDGAEGFPIRLTFALLELAVRLTVPHAPATPLLTGGTKQLDEVVPTTWRYRMGVVAHT